MTNWIPFVCFAFSDVPRTLVVEARRDPAG